MLDKASLILSEIGNSEQAIDLLIAGKGRQDWAKKETEGQLSVDVISSSAELIIVATMAGTKAEDIELHLHNDFLTIRGRRSPPVVEEQGEYYFAECFWGKFSRTIVLPSDVKAEMARAEYKNGILTIRLPKSMPASSIPIMVIEEE